MISKLILGFAALALTACALLPGSLGPQPTPIPTFPSSSSATQDSNIKQPPALGGKQIGDLFVWIFSTPNPPIRGSNIFEAVVTDTKGQPISDATLAFDIDMTNMSHGKNIVTASSLGEGHYRGEVHFLMPGPWRVIVSIDRAGQKDTVRFDFMVNF